MTSLSRPSGNMTGFTPFEYGISAKWLELLKQIDRRVNRAGVLRDPTESHWNRILWLRCRVWRPPSGWN